MRVSFAVKSLLSLTTILFIPGPDDCTFETDLCGFTNVDGDDFDWTQRMGKTPSSKTGPEVDHTTLRFGEF